MTFHRELRPCELLQLEKFRPRRVRRDWKATLWTALRLLVLSAICGAAWSAARAAEPAQPLTQRERAEGIWIAGGLLLGLMALVALAVRKQGRERRGLGEVYAEEDPYAGHWADYQPEVGTLKREQRAHEALIVSPSPSLPVSESDCLSEPAEGLTPEETARILKAVAAELKLTRSLVQGAQRSVGAEDYGDALAGAEKRLGLLRTTVLELWRRFRSNREPRTVNRELLTKEVCHASDPDHPDGESGYLRQGRGGSEHDRGGAGGAARGIEREGSSARAHLQDLRFASLCIQARPFEHISPAAGPRTLNQEAGGR